LQNKSFKFKLSDAGFYELLRFMPYFRKVNLFGIVGIIVISTILFFYWNSSFQETAGSSSEVMFASIIALILSMAVLLVFYLIFRFRINAFLKKSARNSKEKYQSTNDEDYIITFDKNQRAFLLGNRQQKIGIAQELRVISTSRHLLFYHGHGKSQNKFYIPKNGNQEYQENIKYISDFLKKLPEVHYEEKEKRPS
jgi:hypothetical protein